MFLLNNSASSSFFITENNAFATVPVKKTQPKQKLINDFDSDLILEKIDKTVENKAVRINLKINAIKKNLTLVNEDLGLIDLLKLDKDEKKRKELLVLKEYLEENEDSMFLKDKSRKVLVSVPKTDEIAVVVNLIVFAPSRLIINCYNALSGRIAELIKYLFADRVSILI